MPWRVSTLRDRLYTPASWLVGILMAGSSIVSLLQHVLALPLAPTLTALVHVYRETLGPFFAYIHAPLRWLGWDVPVWFQDVQTLALLGTNTMLQSANHPFLNEPDHATQPRILALAQGCFPFGASLLLGYTGVGCILLPFIATAMLGGTIIDRDEQHARRIAIMGWATVAPALLFYLADLALLI